MELQRTQYEEALNRIQAGATESELTEWLQGGITCPVARRTVAMHLAGFNPFGKVVDMSPYDAMRFSGWLSREACRPPGQQERASSTLDTIRDGDLPSAVRLVVDAIDSPAVALMVTALLSRMMEAEPESEDSPDGGALIEIRESDDQTLTPGEAVSTIRNMLLARIGQTITPAVADERARNIVAAFMGVLISE